MPSEVYKLTTILGRMDDAPVNVRDFNRLVTELNKALSEIAVTIGKTKGQDGAIASFVNNIDMEGNNVLNVGQITFSARKHAKGKLPFTGQYNIDDPTDTPADADALRDDLSDNIFPDIEEALNDLGAQVLRILEVLQI